MNNGTCPKPEELAAFLIGKLPEELIEAVGGHLGSCAECQSRIETLECSAIPTSSLLLRSRLPGIAVSPACQRAIDRAELLFDLRSIPSVQSERLGFVRDYELLEQIGKGGMGHVYKARHSKLKRNFALKVLSPSRAPDKQAIARFCREMEAVGSLNHPNIVTATDSGEADGVQYLAMEFVEGMDLSRLVELAGPPTIANACELARQAAEALQHVHEHDLVHRDIKPSNLMLTPTGHVKLLDLGLAALCGERAVVGELTEESQVLGTADYVAPEQVNDSRTVDIRADIYSLGCTLYKLLTGNAPFSGPSFNTRIKKAMAHVHAQPVPVIERRPDMPAQLAHVVDKMLQKPADNRYATPAAVATALEPFTDGSDLRRMYAEVVSGRIKGSSEPGEKSRTSTFDFLGSALSGTDGHNLLDPVQLANCGASALAPESEAVASQQQNSHDPSMQIRAEPAIIARLNESTAHPPRSWLALVGFATGAILLGAIWAIIRDQQGREVGRVKLPDKGSVELRAEDDRQDARAATNPGSKSAESADADSGAAEWVLSIDGIIKINENGKEREIKAAGELPRGPFELRSVDLDQNQKVSDAGLAHFKDCKNLTFLRLGGTQVTNAGLAHFKDCNNLTHLYLGGTQVSDAGLAHFKNCKNLTFLSLHSTQVTNAGLAHFKDCNNLAGLYLDGTQVSDAGLAHFKNCKNLMVLSLPGTEVSDAGLAHFKNCKNVTALNLQHTPQVSDAGLAHFKNWKNLEDLRLDGTQVSDAGLAHFKECKNLTALRLDSTKVSDAGLPDLASLPSLTVLHLVNTRISLRGHEQLKAAMPKCQIIWSETNRSVAESVLALGGTVEIGSRDAPESRPIKANADLPVDYFQVRRVSLAGVAQPLDKLPELLSSLGYPEFDRLESIDLSGITGLEYSFLVPIHGLRELSLANTELNDAALAQLPKLPALKRLVLDGNEIRGTGLAHLSGRPGLIDLSLGCPNLNDLVAKNLAELKQVKRLSLAGSGLTDEGIKHLAGLRNLEWLDLRRTKASAAGVAELQEALPKCQINRTPE